MVSVDELPNFSGRYEDASQWLKAFVIATRSDNESVMLRMFPIHLEPDSPAQKWYDNLADDAVATWSSVERKFRQRWLSRAEGQAETGEEDNVEKVKNHRLTDDDIFSPTSIDVIAMQKVIVDWVDSHAQLGAATKLDNATLIQATTQHLPAFLRAFLRYQSTPPTTFQSLCTRIKEITDPILEFEQLRRQEKNVEWLAELLDITKKYQADVNKHTPPQGGASDGKITDIIATTNGAEEDPASLSTPANWKKAKISVNKAGMVKIVKEAIRALLNFKQTPLAGGAARMVELGLLHYYSAIDALGQFRYNRVPYEDGDMNPVMQGIFQINYHRAFNEKNDAVEATKTWESFSDPGHVIRRDCIYKPTHTHHCHGSDGTEYSNSQKDTLYYWGYVQKGDGVTFPHFGINSFRTMQYFLLSVYLAQGVNKNSKAFKQAAIDSANWIKKWCLDEDTHLVKRFTWNIWQSKEWGIASPSPYMAGFFIEGLCVLASVTGEQTWRDLAARICDAAMAYQDWHDDEGIFNYTSSSGALARDEINTFRGLLFRGLSVAYRYNTANKRLRDTIRNYINIQFNALRDHAYYQGSYAVICGGPFGITESRIEGQVVAIDVFTAAVIVNHC